MIILLGFHMSGNEKIYPSDLTREGFEAIRPRLETARKKTKPREADLFHVFNAVCIFKNGLSVANVTERVSKVADGS